jgi:HlyD family secretion protein
MTWAMVGVGGLVLAGGTWYFVAGRGEGSLASSGETASVTKQDFDITTTASGELEARNRVELRSGLERQSLITFIVPEGVRVKAGDLVVQLQTDQLKTELDEVEAQVVSARAQLVSATKAYEIQQNENESKLRQSRLAVTIADLTLAQWFEGDVAIKRRDLSLSMERAEVELERLADRYGQSQDLYEKEFVSKDEMDRDEVSYIEAISQWKVSQLQKVVYETYQYPKDEKQKRSDVTEAEAEVERVLLNNSSELERKAADRANAEQTLALRESRQARLKQQFASATIIAPQDGLVVYATSLERGGWGGRGDVTLQIGQQVSPNQLMVILPDTSEMLAAVRVPETMAGRVRKGMPASVRVDAAGGLSLTGQVESIGVIAETGGWRDPNLREYTVRISLDIGANADRLKPSMRAEARLTLGDAKNALTVPIQAVFQDGPVQYVNKVVGAGKVERVPIKLGKRSDTRAEILAGVSLGDSVLLRDPQAAELAFKGWNADQLKSVGYVLDEKGQPMPSRGQSGMPGPGGGPPKGERPTGAAQPGGGAGASPGGGAPRGERRAREGSGGQDAGGGGGAPQQPGTAGAPTAAPKVPAGTK